MKIRCTVIDDEPFALDLIKDYILRTPFLELAECFSNPFKALDYLNRVKVDLIFLDINMPELSGIELYKSLLTPPKVIFTTAYPEFAAESYEYNAVDYLVKPVKYERFLKAVNKASSLIQTLHKDESSKPAQPKKEQESYIFIKSGTQQVKVNPNDILYVEAEGNYMCFHTNQKKIMSLLTMKDVLELLPADEFVRLHKSYIIAVRHLEAIEKHDVVVGGKKIPIGVTFREHFLEFMRR